MVADRSIVPAERIASRIYLIRGEKIMLDQDLAELYEIETKALIQAVKRNIGRFPEDFMFRLSDEEFENLRSQIVTSSEWGGRRYAPYAFTEQGVAMLSSVLRGERAAAINVAIIRTFVKLRQILSSNRDLARKVEEHDRQITVLFDTVRKLLSPDQEHRKSAIGYIHLKD